MKKSIDWVVIATVVNILISATLFFDIWRKQPEEPYSSPSPTHTLIQETPLFPEPRERSGFQTLLWDLSPPPFLIDPSLKESRICDSLFFIFGSLSYGLFSFRWIR
jgi:hypothetical protein